MTIILREHQESLVGGIREAFEQKHKSVMAQLCTGGGKTAIASYITQKTVQNNRRVLALVHRREIFDQFSRAYLSMGVNHSLIIPNVKMGNELAMLASVQTLVSRIKKNEPIPEPDLIIADEGHHAIASQWQFIMARFPNARILGMSATPTRTDGTGLDKIFSYMVCGDKHGASMKELIKKGYLSPYQVFSQRLAVDLLDVRIASNGDYDKNELADRLKSVIGCEVAEYKKHLHGKPAIAFYPTVETAEIGSEKFRQAGYRAISIDGSMKPAERKKAIADLGNGNLDVLTSCDVISEGTDIPVVVGALLLTKSKSIIKYLQQVGRALRSAKGKTHAIILDFVGNVGIHGLPCEDREWSLEGVKRRKREVEVTERITQCDNCSHHFLTKNRVCDRCGWVLEFTEKRKTIIENGELISVSIEYFEKVQMQLKFERKREDAQARSLQELISLGVSRGYSNPQGWALHKMKARSNKW
jgi:DNA repair protein RadD